MSLLALDTVTFRTTDEILALVRGFEDCTLPRTEWTALKTALCRARSGRTPRT